MDFQKRYEKLNKAQRQAVDTIDGPVMVIAGPGTGKTELLSVRVANILNKTDILPENILCLTFTDSGANAMRERLTEIIGKEAYKVSIHTFHSFGSEIINQNGQYFYQGAHFLPANELNSYEIMCNIFDELEYNNPLASKINDEYTHLSDSLKTISELKKSGLTSDELLTILDKNNAVIEKSEQLLSPIFANRISKKTSSELLRHIKAIKQSGTDDMPAPIIPLSKVITDSLIIATDEAISQNSTKPITAWRNYWFKKDQKGIFILKTHERQIKLRSISFIYEKYLNRMQEASLYDFDDMILRIVHAMEVFNDLRFNLQEKYQYIMVDEFQDTNMAQMRILHNLTNNEAHGDTPNILVVGDDDQAIYSFQGADISNIIDFILNYPKSKQITLTENYRSHKDILSGSRDIIIQGNNRLENIFDNINKKLTTRNNKPGGVYLFEAASIENERHFIVNNIKSKIKSGIKPNNIAILTRRHHEINSLLPYFSQAGISISYERRDDALKIAPIILIEQISNLLIYLSRGLHDDANAIIPKILAHKAWNIPAVELWKLSTKAYNNRTHWMDVMATSSLFEGIYNWLIETSILILDTPLEQMLDIIIGKPQPKSNEKSLGFISPIYDYFFSEKILHENPYEYLIYLESLRTIRSELREYSPNQTPNLNTFIEYISLNKKIGRTISVIHTPTQADNAINIMTAHKSKGLEFDIVYVINVVDTMWGGRARSRNRLINYPENLPIAPAGETEDERLRLFYVATTRAKNQLHISYSLKNDNNKETPKAAFLLNSKWNTQPINIPSGSDEVKKATELAWYQTIVNPINADMKKILQPMLSNYKLSATHLNNFLDVTSSGPSKFLLHNLLRFPQATNPNTAYGTAIHNTLQQAHSHFSSTGNIQAIEDIVSKFESNLSKQYMNTSDFQNFLQKGSDVLRAFLNQKYNTFTVSQRTELDFSNQHSIVENAHLTGKLDLVDIDTKNKTFIVTDYKTGKPSFNWNGKDEFEKIKLYKYKHQLLFYKLLIENATNYRNYKVKNNIIQFIEPTKSGDIVMLDIEFSNDEINHFSRLINAVWHHITTLDFPDITNFDKSYKGMLDFEQYLIDNIL